LDVLLAPSTWPESYGLVTREALSHDLWVVASDLGAISEGIENGRNGYVIDTSTTAALKKLLHNLDERHERYRRRPESAGLRMRATEEQARELHAIYWEIAVEAGQPRKYEKSSRAA
jgi:glycosyltransferase involved in cell wall biosynthesis